MRKSQKRYSYEVEDKIKLRIPESILEAMTEKGWNVFGIYELVQDELRREKIELKRTSINGTSTNGS